MTNSSPSLTRNKNTVEEEFQFVVPTAPVPTVSDSLVSDSLPSSEHVTHVSETTSSRDQTHVSATPSTKQTVSDSLVLDTTGSSPLQGAQSSHPTSACSKQTVPDSLVLMTSSSSRSSHVIANSFEPQTGSSASVDVTRDRSRPNHSPSSNPDLAFIDALI